ncbi:MAG: hypothetical protein PHI31_08730 [Desulfuromonadaceae bacterium]|nr:hypothetical protein [Desulfuromonadaceae bacterium]
MSKKLIVVTHGIGDADKNFHEEWATVIAQNHSMADIVVKGLWWEDILQKVEEKYDIISGTMGDLVGMCGFQDLEKWAGSGQAKVFKDYMMDVLVYVGLPDMWLMIQDECALRLDALRKDAGGVEQFDESDTILVAHSLGAAMIPHLVWREYAFTGIIPYRGMILLASPLGFESPIPHICQDFLQRMGGIFGGDRNSTLGRFARAWNMGGAGRLRFICNENDIVCSDVKYQVPVTGQLVDLIPIRQGFNPAEIGILNTEHPGAVEFISFGEKNPAKIVENHDALNYLRHPAFNTALKAMLSGGAA